jgi:hypothetical protein
MNHMNLWAAAEHPLGDLAVLDQIPHPLLGEAVLLKYLLKNAKRILDLGTGDRKCESNSTEFSKSWNLEAFFAT